MGLTTSPLEVKHGSQRLEVECPVRLLKTGLQHPGHELVGPGLDSTILEHGSHGVVVSLTQPAEHCS